MAQNAVKRPAANFFIKTPFLCDSFAESLNCNENIIKEGRVRLYMMEKLLFIMENTAICGIIRVVNMDFFCLGVAVE